MESKRRVLVVDDSVVFRKTISGVLRDNSNVEVVGTASNGRIALQRVIDLKPDIITLDMEMPVMDGLQTLVALKAQGYGGGVLLLSGETEAGAKSVMEALSLGAFDFVVKPSGPDPDANAAKLRTTLLKKFDAFRISELCRSVVKGVAATSRCPAETERASSLTCAQRSPEVVALGISTGGPAALLRVVPNLPANFPVPILIVQHMPAAFTKSLADDLNNRAPLHVREATDGERFGPGDVLIAPGGRQMKVVSEAGQNIIRITDDAPENSCSPSVDYLFRSIANIYGGASVGLIMTGMGRDGADGCRLMKSEGSTIVAQDQATCVVYGMPSFPAEEGIADLVVPLDEIASQLTRIVSKGAVSCS